MMLSEIRFQNHAVLTLLYHQLSSMATLRLGKVASVGVGELCEYSLSCWTCTGCAAQLVVQTLDCYLYNSKQSKLMIRIVTPALVVLLIQTFDCNSRY